MSTRWSASFRRWCRHPDFARDIEPRLVSYPELPTADLSATHDSVIDFPPGGRGIFVAATVPAHERPDGQRPHITRGGDTCEFSTSFSTVATVETTQSSDSDAEDFPESTQTTADEPLFDHDGASEDDCLPAYDRHHRSRLTSFSSTSSSEYAGSLTYSDWGEVRAQADRLAQIRAAQAVAPERAERAMDGLKPAHSMQFSLPCTVRSAPLGSESLLDRLATIWPALPSCLVAAPLAAQWEVMRVLLHCGIDPAKFDLGHRADWKNQDSLWADLRNHELLGNAKVPDMCEAQAWESAVTGKFGSASHAVTLICTARMTNSKIGPAFTIALQPLKLDLSCRLFRKYRSSRFIELRIPAMSAWKVFDGVADGPEKVAALWLTKSQHFFLGRHWSAFFVKESGQAIPARDIEVGGEKKKAFQERIMLFSESRESRRDDMLDWLLKFERNRNQKFLKLYSRISLALSKSYPSAVLGVEQIRHHDKDILSPSGKVMNDGVGRVSPSLMVKIRNTLGLSDTPCAVQARLGSAKGMWIVDGADTSNADWIETYPSQRKWKCDWLDEAQRTLEIKTTSDTLVPAKLNMQTLQILSDRAHDREGLHNVLGKRLVDNLELEFQSLRDAIKSSLLLRQWINEQGVFMQHALDQSSLGGLPDGLEERIAFLLDGGFEPQRQKYLQHLVFQRQRQKCEKLKNELKIKLGMSTYAYMVVDFQCVLDPDEVHLCFSRYNDGENDWHDLDGCDVLVGRCPAHLPSDIQKVRAVFKPELRHLRDVIVFSQKGDGPLADKLSGGDYDGDRAWVCWDQEIVENFGNAGVPDKPDLSRYFREESSPVQKNLYSGDERIDSQQAIQKFFEFSLKSRFLGTCTNYKEKLCYSKGNSSDSEVVALSWLLGELVDLPKKGLLFEEADWRRFRVDTVGTLWMPDDPQYKADRAAPGRKKTHIIDYLKFTVSQTAINREIEALADSHTSSGAVFHDSDICRLWDDFEILAQELEELRVIPHGTVTRLHDWLKSKVEACLTQWKVAMAPQARKNSVARSYRGDVERLYKLWKGIDPYTLANDSTDEGSEAEQTGLVQSVLPILLRLVSLRHEVSAWELLKASLAFKLHHARNSNFVWQMAGVQLQYIKSFSHTAGNAGQVAIPVDPLLYSALRPNKKIIKQMKATSSYGSRPGGHTGHGRRNPEYWSDGSEDDDEDERDGSDTNIVPLYELK